MFDGYANRHRITEELLTDGIYSTRQEMVDEKDDLKPVTPVSLMASSVPGKRWWMRTNSTQ